MDREGDKYAQSTIKNPFTVQPETGENAAIINTKYTRTICFLYSKTVLQCLTIEKIVQKSSDCLICCGDHSNYMPKTTQIVHRDKIVVL